MTSGNGLMTVLDLCGYCLPAFSSHKYLATGFQAHGVKDFICSICVYLMNNIQFMIIKSSNLF